MAYDVQKDARATNGKRGNIVLFYSMIGPPAGGLLVYLYVVSISMLSAGPKFWSGSFLREPFQMLTEFVTGLIYVVLLSYIFGGVQALMTGLSIAAASKRDGKFSYALAVIIPATVGAIVMFLLAVTTQAPFEFGAFLGAIGIGASVMIRFIFRRRFGRMDS